MGRRAIERAFEAAGGFRGACPVCFGPSEKAPWLVVLDEGEELPACAECGQATDQDGLTVCRVAGRGPKVLVFPGGAEALLAT